MEEWNKHEKPPVVFHMQEVLNTLVNGFGNQISYFLTTLNSVLRLA